MSKKKKNIRRKKSNNLLKGVAAAGAVVGGGTIFAGNNAVYAAELDNESQVSDLSESQASTSSYMSESLSQSDSTTVDYASIENSTNVSVSQSAYDSTVESEKNSIVESNSISDSVSLSESQLASTSESESTSVSVSDSESLVNSETVNNDEVSSNKFGNLINGLFKGNKNVSAANYATPTGEGSAMLTAESESDDPETSMSKHFSESVATSTSISTAYGIYGSEVADNVLNKDNAYVVKSDKGPIKEGVLVKNNNGYEFIYLYNGKALKTQINGKNVKIDEDGNATINWNGYFIDDKGNINLTSQITDKNDVSGDKTFMTIYENGQAKDVFVVRKDIEGTEYWVPVKVDVNKNGVYQYVEIQNDGDKTYHDKYSTWLRPKYYVQIKIGDNYFYLDQAEYDDLNGNFDAIKWETRKNSINGVTITPTDFEGKAVLDFNNKKRAIDDMNANKTSYSETNSKVVSESNSFSSSISTSLSVSASSSLSAVASTSASQSASASESASVSASQSTSESLSTSESYATSVVTSTAGGGTSYRQVVVDTRAPLQVAPRETEEVVEDETPKANPEKETETIEKEKMPKSTLDVTHRVWWSWVPIVGALVSLVNAHASKKARNDASKERNDASKEKEDK